MPFLRKYGVLTVSGTTAIRVPLIKRGVVDFAVGADWTPAAGDVKILIDGTAAANVANLPTAIASGNTAVWEFILTLAELTGKQMIVTVADSATKAVEDQSFIVETFGNASAMYPPDFTDAVRLGLTALPNAAAEAAGGLYTRGSGAGQINQNANGQVDTRAVAMANGIIAAATFAANALDAVWSTAARVLTAATNITSTGGTTVPQTGDSFARLGAAGAGLTALGDARIANLDATISSRTKPADTQAAVTIVGTTLSLTTNNDKTGYGLSAAAVTAIWNEVVDGAFTARQLVRGSASALLAICSGMATGTGVFRDISNTKNRITATQDANGNRSAVTLDLT